MKLNPNSAVPIFMQIAEQIEDGIFTKIFEEENQIPSTTEISSLLNINPHTVLKGMNLLVSEDIIYKKRGLGMFVKSGATKKIADKRMKKFGENFVTPLIKEGQKLGLSKDDIKTLIERVYEHDRN